MSCGNKDQTKEITQKRSEDVSPKETFLQNLQYIHGPHEGYENFSLTLTENSGQVKSVGSGPTLSMDRSTLSGLLDRFDSSEEIGRFRENSNAKHDTELEYFFVRYDSRKPGNGFVFYQIPIEEASVNPGFKVWLKDLQQIAATYKREQRADRGADKPAK